MPDPLPNTDPGTAEAVKRGCTCPVIDNHFGRGFRGQAGVFVFTEGCPVHCLDVAALRYGDLQK